MGCKITLKGLVLLLESLEFVQLAVAEVLALEHLLLALGPALVDLCFVLELLGQMLQPLQPVGVEAVRRGLHFTPIHDVHSTSAYLQEWKMLHSILIHSLLCHHLKSFTQFIKVICSLFDSQSGVVLDVCPKDH